MRLGQTTRVDEHGCVDGIVCLRRDYVAKVPAALCARDTKKKKKPVKRMPQGA